VKTFVALIALALCGYFCWSEVRGLGLLQKQITAESFPHTEGKVISGDVETSYGSKSTHYIPELTYSYEVNGVDYTGQRYRYGRFSFSSKGGADGFIARHLNGSEIDVYYNPENPADSLLAPRVMKQDVSLLFMTGTPLGIFAWAVWNIVAEMLKPVSTATAGGQKIISDGVRTRVRLPRRYPGYFAAIAFTGVALLATLWTSTVKHPVEAGKIALGILIVIPSGVYAWAWRRIALGKKDLVIDDASRTIDLPQTFSRNSPVTMPFSEVSGIILEKVAHQGRYEVRYTSAPTLQLRDGSTQRLTDLTDKRAVAFAVWLSEKIGVEYSGNRPQQLNSSTVYPPR
jgi:hypothetical protein